VIISITLTVNYVLDTRPQSPRLPLCIVFACLFAVSDALPWLRNPPFVLAYTSST